MIEIAICFGFRVGVVAPAIPSTSSGSMRGVVVERGLPSCPLLLSPQHLTVPLFNKAQENFCPTATDWILLRPGTLTGEPMVLPVLPSRSSLLAPQHQTSLRGPLIAQLCAKNPDICAVLINSGGLIALAVSKSLEPESTRTFTTVFSSELNSSRRLLVPAIFSVLSLMTL